MVKTFRPPGFVGGAGLGEFGGDGEGTREEVRPLASVALRPPGFGGAGLGSSCSRRERERRRRRRERERDERDFYFFNYLIIL